MKILILVLSLDKEPFKTIENEEQKKTWALRSNFIEHDVEVFWYQGRDNFLFDNFIYNFIKATRFILGKYLSDLILIYYEIFLSKIRKVFLNLDNNLIITTPDRWSLISPKLHRALEWSLKNRKFNYLWRTNSSSYTDIQGLLSHVGTIPEKNIYSGPFGKAENVNGNDIDFASGTGILLSRDVVETIVNSGLLLNTKVDDLSVGEICQSLKIELTPISKNDIDSLNSDLSQFNKNLFLTRCKSKSDRNIDVEIMKIIHELYKSYD